MEILKSSLSLFILAFSINSLFALHTSEAQKAKINKNPLTIEQSIPSYTKGSDNKKALITLYLKLAPKHKAYENIFKVSSENTKLSFSQPVVAPLSPYVDKFSNGKERLVMKDEGTLRVYVSSTKPISGEQNLNLTYQACTTEYCLLPKDVPLTVNFPELKNTRKVSGSTTTSFSIDSFFKNFEKQSAGLILLVVYLFGLLTAFTPCVFPMIPITMGVLGFSDSSSRMKGFSIGLSYSIGLSLTYALIGVIVALTGGFIGQALTNPYVIWSIFIFYIGMALAMAGVFTIKAPAALENSFTKIGNKGIIGALITGAIAGVIASPCVGPAVAAVLAYVAQAGNPVFGFFTLLIWISSLVKCG